MVVAEQCAEQLGGCRCEDYQRRHLVGDCAGALCVGHFASGNRGEDRAGVARLEQAVLDVAACHVDLGSGGRLLDWKVLYDDDFEEEDEARP